MDVERIQSLVKESGADVWLMVDYENKNPAVAKLLGNKMLTRKIFVAIPAEGRSFVIAHFIDTVFLHDESIEKDFDIHSYNTWEEMLHLEKELLSPYGKILMDVSEFGLLPRVSLADYGSVDYVKSLGKKVLSSADLQQSLTAKLSFRAYELQKLACRKALKIKDEAFRKIRDDVLNFGVSDEYEVQQFICRRFKEEGMVYDEAPIVAIGPNASNPHYGPDEKHHSPIKMDDLVLIDMWAKMDDEEGVYADITWMAYVGTKVPSIYKERFEIVKAARDGVIDFLKENLPLRKVAGYEADDVARAIIKKSGYGQYFLHRVGHNIGVGVSPHGPGANLDNYESHDFRELLDGTSFSDEPGIYAPDFGMRSETDLHNEGGELVVLAGLQEEIVPLLTLD